MAHDLVGVDRIGTERTAENGGWKQRCFCADLSLAKCVAVSIGPDTTHIS